MLHGSTTKINTIAFTSAASVGVTLDTGEQPVRDAIDSNPAMMARLEFENHNITTLEKCGRLRDVESILLAPFEQLSCARCCRESARLIDICGSLHTPTDESGAPRPLPRLKPRRPLVTPNVRPAIVANLPLADLSKCESGKALRESVREFHKAGRRKPGSRQTTRLMSKASSQVINPKLEQKSQASQVRPQDRQGQRHAEESNRRRRQNPTRTK